LPNYVRPFAYKQLAWISFFHGAPTFRCSLCRGNRAGVVWQNQQCPNLFLKLAEVMQGAALRGAEFVRIGV
jgi:hypothetical protein